MIFSSLEERYHDVDYWTGKLQLELFRLIKQHLDETGLSQNAFARQIGVSKGYMSQVLNGNFDHKLSKLVSLALAIGKLPSIYYEDVDKVVARARGEYEPLRRSFVSATQQITLNTRQANPSDRIKGSASSSTNILLTNVA
jgi:transcriptional regulator with XRE-family HTH domain